MRKSLSLLILSGLVIPLGAHAESDAITLVSVPSVTVAIDDEGVGSCIRRDAFVFDLALPGATTADLSVSLFGVTPHANDDATADLTVTGLSPNGEAIIAWSGEGFEGVQGDYGATATVQGLDAEGELVAWDTITFNGSQDHRAPEVNDRSPGTGAATLSSPAQVRVGFDEVIVTGHLEVTSSVQGPITGPLILGAAEITLDPEPPLLLGDLTIDGYGLDAWCNRGAFSWTSGPVVAVG